MHNWQVGEEIHGFAAGAFGRDSYACRVVEAVGPDWIVTRSKAGEVEMASGIQIPDRVDAVKGVYCSCD